MSEIDSEAKNMPYKVKEGKGGSIVFDVDNMEITPVEISAKVLGK